MKRIRFTSTVRWLMILAIAAFPAVVAAQSAQPSPAGDRGELAPFQELSLTARAVGPLAATAPTFGTTYVTVTAQEFFNFYNGTYENAGSGLLRWGVTGTGNLFMVAAVKIPNGVTVTELEFYVLDNNATVNATVYLFPPTPGINSTGGFGINASTSGASATVQTLSVPFTPFVFDSTTQALMIGFVTTAADASVAIAGARIGYTGAPGQLIMFPAPDRFVDTRTGRGGKSSKYVDGEAFDHTITGVAGLDGNIIPVGATAILGIVSAANPTQNGQFKILPGGTLTTLGRAVVLFNGGFNTTSAFTVRLDSLGRIRGFHSSAGGTTDLVVDVVGYYR